MTNVISYRGTKNAGLRAAMVCHDWGGMLGLRLLAEHPDRFRRVVASNTGFDTGDEDLSQAWPHLAQWFQLTQRADPLDVGGIIATYSTPPLDPAVPAAYDAPFPDNAHLEGCAGSRCSSPSAVTTTTARRSVTPGRCSRPWRPRSCAPSATGTMSPAATTPR